MRQIPLTQGKFALVDDEDFNWLNQWKWFAFRANCGHWDARRNISIGNGDQVQALMHRVIMGLERGDGKQVDHINCNSLDNRRENLRIVDSFGQAKNRRTRKDSSTGLKGAYPYKPGIWRSHIRVNKKHIALGYFKSPEAAHEAYCEAAKKYHGDFARTK